MKTIRQETDYRPLRESSYYKGMQGLADIMDRYGLDGIIGFIPYGIGDIFSLLFGIVQIWFSASYVKSVPLTLSITVNLLRDTLIGMLPFFVGDVADFFYRAQRKNMALINGYLDHDEAVIKETNRKATLAVVLIFLFIAAIITLVFLLIHLVTYATGFIQSL